MLNEPDGLDVLDELEDDELVEIVLDGVVETMPLKTLLDEENDVIVEVVDEELLLDEDDDVELGITERRRRATAA